MTLTVLASVSLFALVSTARPLRHAEEELLPYVWPVSLLLSVPQVTLTDIMSLLAIMKPYEQF